MSSSASLEYSVVNCFLGGGAGGGGADFLLNKLFLFSFGVIVSVSGGACGMKMVLRRESDLSLNWLVTSKMPTGLSTVTSIDK